MDKTNSLIKKLTKELKYRSLPELMGRKLKINQIETIEEDIKNAIREIFSEECKLISTNMEGTMTKYDFLALRFSTDSNLLESEYESGITLLEKLGFLIGKGEQKYSLDPDFMPDLEKDVDRNKKYIRMFIRRVERRPIRKILEECQKFNYNLPPRLFTPAI